MFVVLTTLCSLFVCVHKTNGLSVQWIPDDIQLEMLASRPSLHKWNNMFTIKSNGPVYDKIHKGHVRFNISAGSGNNEYRGLSDCVSVLSTSIQLSSILNSMDFAKFGRFMSLTELVNYGYDVPFSDLFTLRTNVASSISSTSSLYKMSMVFSAVDSSLSWVNVTYTTDDCDAIMTIGSWDDGLRWQNGVVPNNSASVVIPAGSGAIMLPSDVSVNGLVMEGGVLLAHSTVCPDGWAIDPNGSDGLKCYMLHAEPLSFAQAESVCHSEQSLGSGDAHLIQIRDQDELFTAKRLCRGTQGSTPKSHGCWIGMRDPHGLGRFDWIDPEYVGSDRMFMDWRRGEPNNHTVSEGVPTNGELCVELVPWQEDPLIQEQGSWNDEACALAKPYICQLYAATKRFTVNVLGNATLSSGSLEGGQLVLNGVCNIVQFSATRSANITLTTGASLSIADSLVLNDGASLSANCPVYMAKASLLGEPATTVEAGYWMQPVVHFGPDSALSVRSACTADSSCSAEINARVVVQGTVSIERRTSLDIAQGGDFSRALLRVEDAAQLNMAGYSARFVAYDAFELVLSNRGAFVGEFYRNITREQANVHALKVAGVYRISVSVQDSGVVRTACIPYNATAAQLTDLLNAVPLVAERGGVTVRRYGDHLDERHGFGFSYRIELDAPQSSHFASGPLSLALMCYGSPLDANICGCAETKVPLEDANGNAQCPSSTGQHSVVSPNACVVPPEITLSRLSTLSFMDTAGDGTLTVSGGLHRLPHSSAVAIKVSTGSGVVTADRITWYGFSAVQTGRIVLAGTGWEGWDSCSVLYSPDWTTGRGLVSELSRAPPFNMTADHFLVSGLGSILSAAPTSNLTWLEGTWEGGVLGGRSTFRISKSLAATNSGKSLRYGATLVILPGAEFNWFGGNISLADGADIFVDGSFSVQDSSAGVGGVFIGEAHLLESPPGSATGALMLEQAAGRNFHSYYGDELPAQLRGGWYQNPLCGDQCKNTSELTVRGEGSVSCASSSVVTFLLPLVLTDESRLAVGSDVQLTMASGGGCGNAVIFDISEGTTLELSGGQMLMSERCTIRGAGELLVSAGSHDLAGSIDAHITIYGGSMLWPLSRGTGGVLTFKGGLLIENTGKLSVEPFSTTILVQNEVVLRDSGIIQFPRIGIAAQASPFDEQDAPDTSPRGNLTATGTMRWLGGTLEGKADFNVLKELFLEGDTKFIRSLAKLVSSGHCEWGSGDLVADDNGDFLNLGTLQMAQGVAAFSSSAVYKGTEVPVENGGDVFALEYHSWDMDSGALDYQEYVRLRTEFVSRAPNHWTEADQTTRK